MHRTPELQLQDDRALAGLAWYTQRKPVFTGGNSVVLLKGGAQLFPALHDALDKARHTVWMAWYMVNSEGEAKRVLQAMRQAARRRPWCTGRFTSCGACSIRASGGACT
jgi:cardiolipin synthase